MAKSIGMDREELQLRSVLQPGDVEISERSFNLIFGGVLVWGFVLNALMVYFLRLPLIRFFLNAGEGAMIGIMIGYIACVIVGSILQRKRQPLMGLIGYHLIAAPVGLLVSIALIGVDSGLVFRAVSMTALITVAMMTVAVAFPQIFEGMGRILGISLLCTLVVSVLGALFFPGLLGPLDWTVAGIMALYIGFDWARLHVCARTTCNAIDMATSLYLDIINLFLRVLRILQRSSRD